MAEPTLKRYDYNSATGELSVFSMYGPVTIVPAGWACGANVCWLVDRALLSSCDGERIAYEIIQAVQRTERIAYEAGRMASEWTPCTSGMPEPDVDVLVWCERGSASVARHHGGLWDVGYDTLDDVTHWMPLPAQPRQETR